MIRPRQLRQAVSYATTIVTAVGGSEVWAGQGGGGGVISLPLCHEMLVPQPANSQQDDVHSSNGHAEDDGCVAHPRPLPLPRHSCFAEVGIHNTHGHQVEEEVAPVQGRVLGGQEGLCLKGPPCRGGGGG